MTDEEKDKARGDEAVRIHEHDDPWFLQKTVRTAARLAREGWMPPEPIDPDLLFVRQVVGSVWDSTGDALDAEGFRKGDFDEDREIIIALAVLRAERERVAALEPKPDDDGWVWISPPAGRAKIAVRHGADGDIIAWRRA